MKTISKIAAITDDGFKIVIVGLNEPQNTKIVRPKSLLLKVAKNAHSSKDVVIRDLGTAYVGGVLYDVYETYTLLTEPYHYFAVKR